MGAEMRRREFLTLLSGALVASPTTAGSQQSAGKISIGFLSVNMRAAMQVRVEAFHQGLRDLGYRDGQNAVVEHRFAEGKFDRLLSLADELVRLNVRVIVTEGTTATRYAKEATSTIPIVMAQDPDPVATGFVASLARPGGNITGLSNLRTDLGAKRLRYSRTPSLVSPALALLGRRQRPAMRKL
jgi:putative tryptophan/tyrosine transport system substrate-binding protein